MSRIIEGRWDCPYCNSKGIKGRYQHCPNCGEGRGEETKFYVADLNDVVSSDIPEKGPDWFCEYCHSYSPFSANFCTNCGAPKGDKTYFDIQNKKETSKTKNKNHNENSLPKHSNRPYTEKNLNVNIAKHKNENPFDSLKSNLITFFGSRAGFFSILAALFVALLVFIFIPRNKTITAQSKNWQRDINIESYEWVNESDWYLPPGGVLSYQKEEIHHYDSVLDHYETVAVEKSERYISGYSTHTRDLGNGYFETYETPEYSTRYYTEYEQKPVYVEVPRYQTKYYYKIQRWIYNRTESAKGNDENPYWPETNITDTKKEREASKKETYTIIVLNKKNKEITFTASYDIWKRIQKGEPVKVKISMRNIAKIVE